MSRNSKSRFSSWQAKSPQEFQLPMTAKGTGDAIPLASLHAIAGPRAHGRSPMLSTADQSDARPQMSILPKL